MSDHPPISYQDREEKGHEPTPSFFKDIWPNAAAYAFHSYFTRRSNDVKGYHLSTSYLRDVGIGALFEMIAGLDSFWEGMERLESWAWPLPYIMLLPQVVNTAGACFFSVPMLVSIPLYAISLCLFRILNKNFIKDEVRPESWSKGLKSPIDPLNHIEFPQNPYSYQPKIPQTD